MSTPFQLTKTFLAAVIVLAGLIGPRLAIAAEAGLLEQDSRAALKSLTDSQPGANALSAKARGILVFPNVVKAGFVLGAQSGDGVMLVNNKVSGYYNTAAVSVGLQAGAQSYGYALFFMSDKVMTDFRNSKNFQIGVGPSIVFIDAGAAKDLNTLTAKADVYGIIFDQKGLMAGAGLAGSKITRLNR